MRHDCASAKPRFLARYFFPLFAAVVGLLAPTSALAHPLGNFSISHYSGIRVERTFLDIRYLIDMAEIPTFQEIQNHELVAKAEDAAVRKYIVAQAETLKRGLTLT